MRSEVSAKIDKVDTSLSSSIQAIQQVSKKIDKVDTSLQQVSAKIDKVDTSLSSSIQAIQQVSAKTDKLIEEINHVKGRLTEVCSKTVEKTYEEILKEITRHIYLGIKSIFIKDTEYLVKHNIIDEQFTCNKVEQRFSEIFSKSKIESIHTDDFLDYIAFIAIVEKCGFKQKIDEIKEKIEEEINKSIIEIIKRDIGTQKLINEICKKGVLNV
ncbi:MAG: hypothetical protein QXK24_03095 [Ignisphaera sp.]